MLGTFGYIIIGGSILTWAMSGVVSLTSATNYYRFSKDSVVTGLERKAIIDLGNRLELFVDDYLIENLGGKAELRLHHPKPKGIALLHDSPWEGNGCGYHTIIKDGSLYRMYYQAWQINFLPGGEVNDDPNTITTCYAESRDGINWLKPELGFHEANGSKANNILLHSKHIDTHHGLSVFKDENPNTIIDASYKAILVTNKPRGLIGYKSPDGIHWSSMENSTVITDGAFDSQNLAFWDSVRGEYRAYWRYFTEEKPDNPYVGIRAIRTATSKDFLVWENQTNLKYVDSPPEQLYTNQIKPYYRAPHLLIGLPTRYTDHVWSESMRALPEFKLREFRSANNKRFGTAVTEGLFMASRDGVTFKRWNEAFLRPGIERPGTWAYGNQYIGWSVVETKSEIEGAPNELSLYATESYFTGNSSALRRYTLRIDGFVSVNAPMSGGNLTTKLLTFKGSKLILNFSSSAAGGIQVEIQDETGNALPGFSLADCPELFGDSLERRVKWKSGSDLSALNGKPVRLHFLIKDADIFSLQFQ